MSAKDVMYDTAKPVVNILRHDVIVLGSLLLFGDTRGLWTHRGGALRKRAQDEAGNVECIPVLPEDCLDKRGWTQCGVQVGL